MSHRFVFWATKSFKPPQEASHHSRFAVAHILEPVSVHGEPRVGGHLVGVARAGALLHRADAHDRPHEPAPVLLERQTAAAVTVAHARAWKSHDLWLAKIFGVSFLYYLVHIRHKIEAKSTWTDSALNSFILSFIYYL